MCIYVYVRIYTYMYTCTHGHFALLHFCALKTNLLQVIHRLQCTYVHVQCIHIHNVRYRVQGIYAIQKHKGTTVTQAQRGFYMALRLLNCVDPLDSVSNVIYTLYMYVHYRPYITCNRFVEHTQCNNANGCIPQTSTQPPPQF